MGGGARVSERGSLTTPQMFAAFSVMAIIIGAIAAGAAHAAPLTVYVHQDNLYRGTRAEVRVYTTVKAKRPGTTTIQVEPLDTRLGNWATEGPATTAHVRLHKGRNRIHKSLTVEMFEERFCAWQAAFAADHPECPHLASYHDPYVRVPVQFNKVFVTVTTADRVRTKVQE